MTCVAAGMLLVSPHKAAGGEPSAAAFRVSAADEDIVEPAVFDTTVVNAALASQAVMGAVNNVEVLAPKIAVPFSYH
jgi:hypothetical protein